MSARAKSRGWKLAVKIVLGCLLASDVALLVVSWRVQGEAPQSQQMELAHLTQKAKLLTADVQKGRNIEKRLPGLTSECDNFYQKNLLPSSSGYTSVISDVGQLARDAGVQTSGWTFREEAVKDRALKEIQVSGTVQGDYQGLIRLIDGIERSPHFYLLDGLALSSETSGMVKLQVSLRTYFRT